MRKFFEKIVEGGLLISGSVSSFTILLIVFFLFKEAGGLFNTPATEEGYVLAVNKSNDVGKLSPEKIMDIFDGNITNWKDISGMDQDILIFRFSDLTNYYTEEELGDEFSIRPAKDQRTGGERTRYHRFLPQTVFTGKRFPGKGTAGREDHIRGVLRRDEMVSDLDTGPYIRINSFVVGHITGQYRRNRTFTSFRNCGCHLHGGNSE